MIMTVSQIALGGAIGAVARYLTGLAVLRLVGAGFPWGTLAINVIGSFLMGVLVVVLAERDAMRLAPFLMMGILGGFTTFSTFSLDTIGLIDRGEVGMAAGYVLASVVLTLGAIVLGMVMARGVVQ